MDFPTPKLSFALTENGPRTSITNLHEIEKPLNRSEKTIISYIAYSLETACLYIRLTKQFMLVGAFSTSQVTRAIASFVQTFVVCKECSSNKTCLFLHPASSTESEHAFLHCKACTAQVTLKQDRVHIEIARMQSKKTLKGHAGRRVSFKSITEVQDLTMQSRLERVMLKTTELPEYGLHMQIITLCSKKLVTEICTAFIHLEKPEALLEL